MCSFGKSVNCATQPRYYLISLQMKWIQIFEMKVDKLFYLLVIISEQEYFSLSLCCCCWTKSVNIRNNFSRMRALIWIELLTFKAISFTNVCLIFTEALRGEWDRDLVYIAQTKLPTGVLKILSEFLRLVLTELILESSTLWFTALLKLPYLLCVMLNLNNIKKKL